MSPTVQVPPVTDSLLHQRERESIYNSFMEEAAEGEVSPTRRVLANTSFSTDEVYSSRSVVWEVTSSSFKRNTKLDLGQGDFFCAFKNHLPLLSNHNIRHWANNIVTIALEPFFLFCCSEIINSVWDFSPGCSRAHFPCSPCRRRRVRTRRTRRGVCRASGRGSSVCWTASAERCSPTSACTARRTRSATSASPLTRESESMRGCTEQGR